MSYMIKIYSNSCNPNIYRIKMIPVSIITIVGVELYGSSMTRLEVTTPAVDSCHRWVMGFVVRRRRRAKVVQEILGDGSRGVW